jgi:type I restriction enzyme S subunit
MENGKCAVATGLEQGVGFGSTEFHVLRCGGQVAPRFVRHFLRQERIRREAEAHMTGSVGQRRVPKTYLRELEIPLPPIDVQAALVERLDHLEVASRRVTARFEIVRRRTEELKMALRAAACTGVLTETWRTSHTAALELGEVQARHSDDFSLGETMTELPDLPDSWAWVRLEDILADRRDLSYGILKPGDEDPDGVPMVRIVDVGDGTIDTSALMHVSPALAGEYGRTRLAPGDVVLAVMATIGRAAVVPDSLEGANVNRALAVLKLGTLVIPEYVSLVLRSPLFRSVFAASRLGSAQARINLGDLRAFPFPLPPVEEQETSLAEAAKFTRLADDLMRHVESGQRSATRVLEASYEAAFAGELLAA